MSNRRIIISLLILIVTSNLASCSPFGPPNGGDVIGKEIARRTAAALTASAVSSGETVAIPTTTSEIPTSTTSEPNPTSTTTSTLQLTPTPAPLPIVGNSTMSLADTIIYRKGQKLICGINGKLQGFSLDIGDVDGDEDNDYAGMDVEFCKAVAVAIFGVFTNTVEFYPNSENNFQAVRDKKVDVVFANTPATYNRNIGEGVDFGPPTFHDEQWVMSSSGITATTAITNENQLRGKKVCSANNTISRLNLTDLEANLGIISVLTDTLDMAFQAYQAGDCDALTGARSELAIKHLELGKRANEHNIFALSENLRSREPWSPFFRENDSRWAEVINSVVYCTIAAEELHVSQKDFDDKGKFEPQGTEEEKMRKKNDPRIMQLLGMSNHKLSANNPGLLPDFCRRIIHQIGNYEDIYNRHLKGILGEERGPNKAWNTGQGGALSAPPPR